MQACVRVCVCVCVCVCVYVSVSVSVCVCVSVCLSTVCLGLIKLSNKNYFASRMNRLLRLAIG